MLNQTWKDIRYCVVDLEGTGAQDKENEAILEIAAVEIINGVVQENYFHSLVNPERKIPRRPWITLANADLKDAPTFDEIKSDLFARLDGAVFVAHNAKVDWRLVSRKYPNFEPIILDTLTLSKKLYPNEKRHNLDALIERFELRHLEENFPNAQRHRAHFDAFVTAHLFLIMCEKHFSEKTTLREIFDLCGISIATKETTSLNEQGSLF